MRYLGIDYGSKRIGISISDPTNTFAIPLNTIENNRNLFNNIKEICIENNIEQVILGYPLNLDGSKSELCYEIDEIVERLKIKIKLPILLRDERFSSKIAEDQVISSVKSRKKRKDKSLIDKFSAAIILQEFLDFKNNEKKRNT